MGTMNDDALLRLEYKWCKLLHKMLCWSGPWSIVYRTPVLLGGTIGAAIDVYGCSAVPGAVCIVGLGGAELYPLR
eukprot:scaffold47508_cov36-Cyclotella_meneghiniana.AAC.1